MDSAGVVMFFVRLFLGGAVSFFAILVWSKTRDRMWTTLALGMVVQFAGTVYDMLLSMGLAYFESAMLFGIPVLQFLFYVVPPALFITAFVFYLLKHYWKM
ncbi:MAG: hypothetical protein J1F14_03245 [Treponema sp.]|nr:hypothetical protein [Treponema sp.]